MDTARGLDDRLDTGPDDTEADDSGVNEHRLDIGTDERRMHVRAYNHWVSLLRGRAYPAIEDLDPESIIDFGPHSVLLDFSGGIENPAIRYLGRSLREECGVGADIVHVGEVPSRSLLSRLTDHYLQIIANRAPIGFEAEFVGQRGHNTLYRGILMPYSSDEDAIDFIYGVINWKEMVDAETQARLEREVEAARRAVPLPTSATPVWADGPSAGISADVPEPAFEHDLVPHDDVTTVPETLAARLMLARESAAAARAADTRSRSSLYRALSRAYDFACAADTDADSYAVLLADADITVQARAPMTAAAKLVFGTGYDKTRLTEFAAVLSHAQRNEVPEGSLDAFLTAAPGGIKAVVKAERALRKPAVQPDLFERAREELRLRPSLGHVEIAAGDHEFVVLLARAGTDGMLEVVANLDDDTALAERAVRKAAA
ncbi:PAS domain-containing protein [Sphingomonas sp. LT1P40]|uniref:PAS domain-containing protein n=1 Tax=Alteristakelama amylovorans TaxID=3096166 RepID=UPI002FC6C26D